MGRGLGINVVTPPPWIEWPTKIKSVTCSGCGAKLVLKVNKTEAEIDLFTLNLLKYHGATPTPMTEQYCPACGTAACEEDEAVKRVVIKNRDRDFFSAFRK